LAEVGSQPVRLVAQQALAEAGGALLQLGAALPREFDHALGCGARAERMAIFGEAPLEDEQAGDVPEGLILLLVMPECRPHEPDRAAQLLAALAQVVDRFGAVRFLADRGERAIDLFAGDAADAALDGSVFRVKPVRDDFVSEPFSD
jgi:hypothetical protein